MDKKKFIVTMNLAVLIIVIALILPGNRIYKDNTKDEDTDKEQKFISSLDSKEEFKYLTSLIENNYVNYPYLTTSNKLDFNSLKDKYSKKLENNLSLPEYKSLIKSYLNEFQDEALYILEYDNYLNLYNNYSNRNESTLKNIVTNPEVKKIYGEFKKETKEVKANSNLVLDTQDNKVAIIRVDDFNNKYKIEDQKKILEFLKKSNSYKYIAIDIRKSHGNSIDYAIENIIKPLSHNTNIADFKVLQRTKDFPNTLRDLNIISGITVNEDYIDSKGNINLQKDEQVEQFPFYQSYSFKDMGTNKANFKGKVFILQSKETTGAADFISQFANRTNFGETVGTLTKGGGIAPINSIVELPKSHLLLSLPYSTGINEDGYLNNLNGTYPEIPLDENADSLDYILNMIN